MNYGPLGIALGMFLLGLLVGWFDRRLRASSIRHATAPFWALASVIAVFSIVGQLNMFTSTLNSFGLPLLAAALIAARRIRDESSVAHAAPLPRTAEGL